MGAESFLVRLVEPRSRTATIEALDALGFRPVEDQEDAYVLERSDLIAEAATASDGTVSVRFAVCHPESADTAFLNLIAEISRQLCAGVEVMGDVLPEHTSYFHAGALEGLEREVLPAIRQKRAYWQEDFAHVQGRMRCREARNAAIRGSS